MRTLVNVTNELVKQAGGQDTMDADKRDEIEARMHAAGTIAMIEAMNEVVNASVHPNSFWRIQYDHSANNISFSHQGGDAEVPQEDSQDINQIDLLTASVFRDNLALGFLGLTGTGKTYPVQTMFDTILPDANTLMQRFSPEMGNAMAPFIRGRSDGGVIKYELLYDIVHGTAAYFADEINRARTGGAISLLDGEAQASGTTVKLGLPIPRWNGTEWSLDYIDKRPMVVITAQNPSSADNARYIGTKGLGAAVANRVITAEVPNTASGAGTAMELVSNENNKHAKFRALFRDKLAKYLNIDPSLLADDRNFEVLESKLEAANKAIEGASPHLYSMVQEQQGVAAFRFTSSNEEVLVGKVYATVELTKQLLPSIIDRLDTEKGFTLEQTVASLETILSEPDFDYTHWYAFLTDPNQTKADKIRSGLEFKDMAYILFGDDVAHRFEVDTRDLEVWNDRLAAYEIDWTYNAELENTKAMEKLGKVKRFQEVLITRDIKRVERLADALSFDRAITKAFESDNPVEAYLNLDRTINIQDQAGGMAIMIKDKQTKDAKDAAPIISKMLDEYIDILEGYATSVNYDQSQTSVNGLRFDPKDHLMSIYQLAVDRALGVGETEGLEGFIRNVGDSVQKLDGLTAGHEYRKSMISRFMADLTTLAGFVHTYKDRIEQTISAGAEMDEAITHTFERVKLGVKNKDIYATRLTRVLGV